MPVPVLLKAAELQALSSMSGYEAVVKNLRQVPFRPARSFYEAVQSVWFCFAFLRLTGCWPGICRIDQMLGGYNDSEEELMRIRSFLETTRFRTVDLLCYNDMSGGKYEEAGITYTAFKKPTPEEMASYRELFCFS